MRRSTTHKRDTPAARKRGRPTSSAQAARNAAIVAERRRGDSWAQIAKRHNLTSRSAQRAHDEHLRAGAAAVSESLRLASEDPGSVVREAIGVLRWGAVEAERVAVRASNDSAAVGAIRARCSIALDLVNVLSAVGVIPRLGDWSYDRDASALIATLFAAAERSGVAPAEVAEEIKGSAHVPPRLVVAA